MIRRKKVIKIRYPSIIRCIFFFIQRILHKLNNINLLSDYLDHEPYTVN